MSTGRNAERPLVMQSWNSRDGMRCVDLFRRPDGSFGFEEYRRDPEDPNGWGGAAGFAGRAFEGASETRRAAEKAVPWLAAEGPEDP